MQPIKKFTWPLVAAIAIAGGSYFGASSIQQTRLFGDTTAQTARPTPEPRTENVAPANDLSRAFRTVHNSLKDAVVNIHVKGKTPKIAQRGTRFHLPDEFKGFSLPDGFDPENLVPRSREATGSGVIVSADGYVLTNNHVVDGAGDITVSLDDGRDLKAKVVGTDPKSDIAVIKITADHLTYAKFGDSDSIDVGDWVLAFGSPFGFQQTMTQGIISAKGRAIDIIGMHKPELEGLTYENFLQTDAAINPGNSGGPLVNLKGEVVGINTAIASNSGAYNGVGFAIPSNDAKYIMDSLIKNGSIVRGYLSVKIEDINRPAPTDQALADSIKKQGFSGKGVLVAGVDPEGPAGNGGVQSGDVIISMDNRPVESVTSLRNQVARTAPGTKVALKVFRDGKNVDLFFPLGTQPERNPRFAEAGGSEQSAVENDALGLSVKSVDADVARQLKLGADKGVVISDVAPGSLAASLGLREGDVVTRVNKTEVNTPKEFEDIVSKSKLSEGLRLSVRTADGMDRTVFVQKN